MSYIFVAEVMSVFWGELCARGQFMTTILPTAEIVEWPLMVQMCEVKTLIGLWLEGAERHVLVEWLSPVDRSKCSVYVRVIPEPSDDTSKFCVELKQT